MRRENHGHQPATTFTIFVECLQERRGVFRQLTRGLYSKTLIRTAGRRALPPHPQASHGGPKASCHHFARQLDHLQGIWIIIQQLA
jgi:hypothetical protein